MRRHRIIFALVLMLALCGTGLVLPAGASDPMQQIRLSAADAGPVLLLAKSVKKAAGQEGTERIGERVISSDEETKVRIRGNSVLVPVTLVNGNHDVDVELLLDTGASSTAIRADIAKKLYLDVSNSKKLPVQVVGGGVLQAHFVKLSRITVGPHTRRNWNVFVVPHNGPATHYDGLLGMDILRGLKYRVDFKREVIIWE